MNSSQRRRTQQAAIAAVLGSMAWGVGSVRADYVSQITSQNPLFYWRFNETATGAIAAEADNSATADNNGVANATVLVGQSGGNALTATGGFVGFADTNTWFSFPATAAGDFVATLTNPLNEMSSTVGSVSHWFRTTTGTDGSANALGRVYHFDQGATGSLYTFIDSTGKVGIRIANGVNDATVLADVRTAGALNDDQWHQVVATWDGTAGTVTLYIDGGALTGGQTITGVYTAGTDFASSNRHQAGKGATNATRYQGSADELAIWTTVLTAQQVADQYLAATTIPEPASLALLACGGLALARRRSMKN